MSLAAVLLAIVTTILDLRIKIDPLSWIGRDGEIKVESARAVLSTIATAILSVAGISFSILIAAVAFASSQFGPRIISNFMRDRFNQLALGLFVATFVYCIIVLALAHPVFVPTISALTALGLALVSIAVLIHFFHHAPDSIQLPTLTRRVGEALLKEIEHGFPRRNPAVIRSDGNLWECVQPPTGTPVIRARQTGFLRILDMDGLVALACAHDLRIVSLRQPGDFLAAGRPLGLVLAKGPLGEDLLGEVAARFTVGAARTPAQDMNFLMLQLIDVAARALSPGVNDPRTAIECLDWIGAALSRAANAPPAVRELRDEAAIVRLVIRPVTFEGMMELSVGHLRPYFETDRMAALAMMAVLTTLYLDSEQAADRALVLEHARALGAGVAHGLAHERDRSLVRQRLEGLEEIANGRVSATEARLRHAWI